MITTDTPTLERNPAPEPGVYVNVASEAYHQWDGVLSKSNLWPMVTGFTSTGDLELCPAKLRYHLEHPREDTDALVVGGALDCKLLEPHEFEQRYIMAGSCAAPKKKGSDEVCGSPGKVTVDGQWRCGTHGRGGEDIPADKTLLDHIQMSQVRGMARSILAHPTVGRYFTEPHEPQVAVVGTVFGRRFKGRFDLFRREGDGLLVDLKTSRNSQPHLFQRDVIKLGYHVQCFLYAALAHQNAWLGDEGRIELVVVGKSSLYGCGKDAVYPVELYQVPDELLELGARHLEQLVTAFDKCEATNEWPNPVPPTRSLYVPRWMEMNEEGDGDEL